MLAAYKPLIRHINKDMSMTNELTLDVLRQRSGNVPPKKSEPITITYLKPLDTFVLMRDLAASVRGGEPFGNIQISELENAQSAYRSVNSLMLAQAITAPDAVVKALADRFTETIEAMNSIEGLESLSLTLGSRLAQINKYRSVDISRYMRAINKVPHADSFAGGHRNGAMLIRGNVIGAGRYQRFNRDSFHSFQRSNESTMRQIMLEGTGLFSMSSSAGHGSGHQWQNQEMAECRAIVTTAAAVVGGAIGAAIGSGAGPAGTVGGTLGGARVGWEFGKTELSEVWCPAIVNIEKDTGSNQTTPQPTSPDTPSSPDTPENDDDDEVDENKLGCVVNPEDFYRQANILQITDIGIQKRTSLILNKEIERFVVASEDRISFNSMPMINTKIGQSFSTNHLNPEILRIDEKWWSTLDTISSSIETMANLSVGARRDIGLADLLRNQRDIENETPLADIENYGVSVSTSSIETDTVVISDNDGTREGTIVDDSAYFTYSSPAMQHLMGEEGTLVVGSSNIQALGDYLKLMSKLALSIDSVTNFGKNDTN